MHTSKKALQSVGMKYTKLPEKKLLHFIKVIIIIYNQFYNNNNLRNGNILYFGQKTHTHTHIKSVHQKKRLDHAA